MTKLTGAALDQAVANVLGIKSVHNCEKWVGLTDEEFQYCVQLKNPEAIAEEVEAKLKEKNK